MKKNRTAYRSNMNDTLEQVTYYYPLGSVYDNEGLSVSKRPYKYNGKELEKMHGLDWYEYEVRQYDTALAQWTAIDLLCWKYYDITNIRVIY